jgi:hypothetical protein
MVKMIKVSIEPGLDKITIKFIQHIEKEIDKVMVVNGLYRVASNKNDEKIVFCYRFFGRCLPEEKGEKDEKAK